MSNRKTSKWYRPLAAMGAVARPTAGGSCPVGVVCAGPRDMLVAGRKQTAKTHLSFYSHLSTFFIR